MKFFNVTCRICGKKRNLWHSFFNDLSGKYCDQCLKEYWENNKGY